MRFLLSSCALVLATCFVTAQTASPAPSPAAPAADFAAAKARVTGALQKCSQLTDTAFVMKWGPDKKKKAADDPFLRMMGAAIAGETKGSWHQDLLHVAFDGDNDDELLLAGRRMLAKDGTNDWRLRAGRFADGNTVTFVPDVPRLLQQLAAWDLAVTNRAVGSLDDRPVEIVTVALNAEQVAEAVWAGLLPEAIVTATGMSGARVFRMAAGVGIAGGGGRPPAPTPESTIDLAIHLDPATNVIHQLHFRGWTKENAAGGGGMVVFAAGPARAGGAGGGGDDEEEDEEKDEKAEAKKDAPLVYENGLPVRSRKKTSVNDVIVKLSQHGKQPAPALSDLAKKLLGR